MRMGRVILEPLTLHANLVHELVKLSEIVLVTCAVTPVFIAPPTVWVVFDLIDVDRHKCLP